MSRLLEPLLGAADDLMDLLERDLKLGVKMHCLSAIVAGSKTRLRHSDQRVHGPELQPLDGGEARRVPDRPLPGLLERRESKGEFEKSFGVFRNRKFKGALSAEFRFHETASPLYDLVTIYGMQHDASLQEHRPGYQAIVGSMPELSVEGAS